MINTFIALLVEFSELTEQEGEALAEKLRLATLPGDYRSAQRQVKQLLDDVRKGK